MGLMARLRGLFSRDRRNLQNPQYPLSGQALLSLFGKPSKSGITVTPNSALSYSPIWSGVDILAGDVSKLPFLTYRRDGENKEEAIRHPTFRLLYGNTGELSSNLWLNLMMGQALLYGNAYSVIHRDGNNQSNWLEWFHRDEVQPRRVEGEMVYQISRNPSISKSNLPPHEIVPAERMFHIRGLTFDTFWGLSLIDYARNTVGRMISAEGWTDDFFANGANLGGFVTYPGRLSDGGKETLRKTFEAVHKGDGKGHRLGILHSGMDWKSTGVTPEDALLVDNLNLGVKDVARFFKIPAHKLGDDTKTSYNSIEQENRAYLDMTLMYWLSRFEWEANEKLFTAAEKQRYSYFTEFDVSRLLRADFETRMKAAGLGIQNGVFSRNEIRRRENLNPYSGGDTFLIPMNSQPVGASTASPQGAPAAGEASETGGDSGQPPSQPDNRLVHRDVLIEELERLSTRLIKAAGDAYRRNGAGFSAYLNTLERGHGHVVIGSLDRILRLSRAEYGIEATAQEVGQRFIDDVRNRLLEVDIENGQNFQSIEPELRLAIRHLADRIFFQETQYAA